MSRFIHKTSTQQPIRVCYLIQTHKNPDQIYRLIRLIKQSSSHCQIVISHDPRFCQLDLSILSDSSNIYLFHTTGGRADFSMVQSYLDAVEWLLNNQIDFDWLINVTGQDYPIKSIADIEDFLVKTDYDGFLEYFDVLSSQSQWSKHEGCSRYFYKYKQLSTSVSRRQQNKLKFLKIINYLQPWVRFNCSYDLRVGVRTKTPFSDGFKCYGGSFFCTLSRPCIEYISTYIKAHPNLVAYYRTTSVSVESFIQTILVNSQLFNLCNNCKRYFDFSRTNDGSPTTLTVEDYPHLLNSDAHFARKFDMTSDGAILNLLDQKILADKVVI